MATCNLGKDKFKAMRSAVSPLSIHDLWGELDQGLLACLVTYVALHAGIFGADRCRSQVQGSKQVPSGCPGQVHVDFTVGQVTSHSHLPTQASCLPTKSKKG